MIFAFTGVSGDQIIDWRELQEKLKLTHDLENDWGDRNTVSQAWKSFPSGLKQQFADVAGTCKPVLQLQHLEIQSSTVILLFSFKQDFIDVLGVMGASSVCTDVYSMNPARRHFAWTARME